jgi:hypothetical protein
MINEYIVERITKKVFELLEKGEIPWSKPWTVGGEMPKYILLYLIIYIYIKMKATYKKKISSWYYDTGCVREDQPTESRKQIREIIKKIDEKIREAKNK